MKQAVRAIASLTWLAVALAAGCGDSDRSWECAALPGEQPDYLQELGCRADFDTLASEPLNASIPGARSAKTVVDRLDDNALYIQNSRKYAIHHDFASAHLSGYGLPFVPATQAEFQAEYYSPDRRFILGAVTYYERGAVWVYEVSPYDTASAAMIETAYRLLAQRCYFGETLYFHPTSQAVQAEAAKLPGDVRVITTEELYQGIDYQPLNLGTSMGRLRFVSAASLENSYVGFRELVILDSVPNDISVVSGIVTSQFQTPLSHINVLSQNRKTPNMALRGAFESAELRALKDKWVRLDVGAFQWSIREVTKAEADQWWEQHKPTPLGVPALDLTVTELRDIDAMLDLDENSLEAALATAIPAFGGKASHYGAFAHMSSRVPHPKAFAIPVHYYWQHLEQNNLDVMLDEMLADEAFQSDPAIRDQRLKELRDAIMAAPIDPAFEALLLEKLRTEYPGLRMRFRSSTNAEDLAGFTGAGLYTSRSGDPNDPDYPVADAVRKVWASVWRFRAFEEREYRSIDHRSVGMALLVHRSFPEEEANGVAITANLFDRSPDGAEPAFYINVQLGEDSVVLPEAGVTTDQLLYFYEFSGKPIVYLAHSSLAAPGNTVLSRDQVDELGQALDEIHKFFLELYGGGSFYGMDVEFKFDGDAGEQPSLYIKQARPYPGWGLK